MAETLSSSIGIPPIQERGIYSAENFSESCKKLSELPDGFLFLRLASKDGIIYYEFSNRIHKSHYSISEETTYDKKNIENYSPPLLKRLSSYIIILFQGSEKNWLTEDTEGNSRRYVFTLRVKDGKLERITREKCEKRASQSENIEVLNKKRTQRIMGKPIQKGFTMK